MMEGRLLIARVATERGEPLHTVGSLRKGSPWESTAVPEPRVQAAELTRQILATRNAADAHSAVGHLWISDI